MLNQHHLADPVYSALHVTHIYSQVQLLVTSQDVENYKQIKSDLDQLRSIVEKSELWVYKRQGSDEGEALSIEPEHKLVQYIVHQKTLKILLLVCSSTIVRPFSLMHCFWCTL